MAIVQGIFISPAKGVPMLSVRRVTAIEMIGLEGDRYALGTGTYSGVRHDKRHITIVGQNDIDAANAGHDEKFEAIDTRRNILVSGETDLLSLIGRCFWLGGAILEGVEECTPCSVPSKMCGKPGFEKRFKGLGGLRAAVIKGGTISIYDRLNPTVT